MATRFFTFAAARITGHDAAGDPLPGSVLDLPVHGLAQVAPDSASHCGERFTLLLALAESPALPRTDEGWGHDVLLWDPSPVPPFSGHREVWLHRVALSLQDIGSGCVSLFGPAWGRSFHLERKPPVPFAGGDCPDWDLLVPAGTV
ncbi:hypothetical protein [Streptomyces sp. 11x1]|uniref:hypothetical protein n=1 Tax=Streptomyces sp. 11x1 TaxID=3038642 RepID=UPI00292D1CF8|nr:hypothetical protein [Streptomyces sp. 11x1]WNZ14939.1 hypothetical protein P8T65_46735 [Streptomyces sp. 11x1]